MTLILTEITNLGIAMAADSAITMKIPLPDNRYITRVLTGFQKIHFIPKINAGISFWGQANFGRIPLDVWLNDFIHNREEEYDSVESFVKILEGDVRQEVPLLINPKPEEEFGTIGFHLAGFEEYKRKKYPVFWHIHNGRSQELEKRGMHIDPTLVNANNDIPPKRIAKLPPTAVYLIRNGDTHIYIQLYERLRAFFTDIQRGFGIIIPITRPMLSDRCEWLRSQIDFMSNLYKFSNLLPSIGGQIATLWIAPNGCYDFDLPNLKINVS